MFQKVKNIINGIWYSLTDDKKTREIAKRRLSICHQCERRIGGVCGVCRCILKFKTRVKSEDCPLGKWKRENDTQDN